MVPAVSEAIAEIRAAFTDQTFDVTPDGSGGACVVIEGIDLGSGFDPQVIWLGFQIQYTYPMCDVYPLFGPAQLRRADGSALGPAFQQVDWKGQAATQISRRSNRMDPSNDTALLKVVKVVEWIRAL